MWLVLVDAEQKMTMPSCCWMVASLDWHCQIRLESVHDFEQAREEIVKTLGPGTWVESHISRKQWKRPIVILRLDRDHESMRLRKFE